MGDIPSAGRAVAHQLTVTVRLSRSAPYRLVPPRSGPQSAGGAHVGHTEGRPPRRRPRLTFDDVAAFPLAMSPLPGPIERAFERSDLAGRLDPPSGLLMPALTLDEVALMKRSVRETDAVSRAPGIPPPM